MRQDLDALMEDCAILLERFSSNVAKHKQSKGFHLRTHMDCAARLSQSENRQVDFEVFADRLFNFGLKGYGQPRLIDGGGVSVAISNFSALGISADRPFLEEVVTEGGSRLLALSTWVHSQYRQSMYDPDIDITISGALPRVLSRIGLPSPGSGTVWLTPPPLYAYESSQERFHPVFLRRMIKELKQGIELLANSQQTKDYMLDCVGHIRRGSPTLLAIDLLCFLPMISTAQLKELFNLSDAQLKRVVDALSKADLLEEITGRGSYRVFKLKRSPSSTSPVRQIGFKRIERQDRLKLNPKKLELIDRSMKEVDAILNRQD